MKSKRYLSLLAAALAVTLAINGCAKEDKASEGSKTETVTVALTPSTQEIKSEQFTLQLSDLQIHTEVDKASKEITTTPNLRGNIKIVNISKNILDVQGVTLQYLDPAGDSIPFKTGEKKTTVSTYWSDLQPGKESEQRLDVTIPLAAVKEKSLAKIQVNVVYVPTPLKRETLEVPVKLAGK
jgi:hypothetical protein